MAFSEAMKADGMVPKVVTLDTSSVDTESVGAGLFTKNSSCASREEVAYIMANGGFSPNLGYGRCPVILDTDEDGRIELTFPPGAPPDTIAHNLSRVREMEKVRMLRVRLQKKLAKRKAGGK